MTAVIRPGRPDDARAVAALHASQISEGFLSSLGPGFLTRLYRRIVASPDAFLLVAASADGSVTGFIAGTTDTRALYRQFLLRDGARAALSAGSRLVGGVRRAVETLRYAGATASGLPAAELLATAVAPTARGRGVGRSLVEAFLAELGARDVAAAKVTVAADNDPARRLYGQAGFRWAADLEVHRGRRSEVMVWP